MVVSGPTVGGPQGETHEHIPGRVIVPGNREPEPSSREPSSREPDRWSQQAGANDDPFSSTRLDAEWPRHQAVAFEIAVELRIHLSTRGRVYCPTPAIRLGEIEVCPDVAVLLVPVHPRLMPRWIQGAPDLVVEVLALERDRDEVVRKVLYERSGVGEYWIADPLTNGCTILVLEGGRYREVEHSRILDDVNSHDVGYWIARA